MNIDAVTDAGARVSGKIQIRHRVAGERFIADRDVVEGIRLDVCDLLRKNTRNAGLYQILGVLGEQILDDRLLAAFGIDFRKLHELSDKVVFNFFIFERFGCFCLIVNNLYAVFS